MIFLRSLSSDGSNLLVSSIGFAAALLVALLAMLSVTLIITLTYFSLRRIQQPLQ